MESSEEESGLLHQVKERLSMSADESASFKYSVKSGRQMYVCLQVSSKLFEENLPTISRAAFYKEIPSKGGAKIVRNIQPTIFSMAFFFELAKTSGLSRRFSCCQSRFNERAFLRKRPQMYGDFLECLQLFPEKIQSFFSRRICASAIS